MKAVVYLVHDFDGSLYFKALEKDYNVKYLISQPFRFLAKDIIRHKRISKIALRSIAFCLFGCFYPKGKFILAMAPFNYRLVFWSHLSFFHQSYIHTSWPYWSSTVPKSNGKFKPIAKWLWVQLIRNFDAVICVTESVKKSVNKFKHENDIRISIEQIYHVVDFPNIDSGNLKKKWIDKARLNIGFLGRLEYEKGIEDFINLYCEDEDVRFDFCVAGRGSFIDKVSSISKDNWSFLGFLSSRSKIKDFLVDLNFLYLPSKKIEGWEELFGLVVIEAMSCGCIVVTSDHVGPKEIISDMQNGFILSESVDSRQVYKLIENLDSNRSLAYSIAYQGLKRSNDFSMSKIRERWIEVLNDLH
ncbi:glycosyltransferase family 4 protein [Vibrio vulnificus]|uniref:glycosyltransferase family 4 protein n=1 Tax=Vibrio vulnificus TaxID=672 RepID=UPI001CDC4642|nr:glycosyltransferase family 4 protein [Vibrio vulnificus]MCA3894937.1 glycosyltransferase family 4 protein [Vibrio vulnificus]